MAILTQYEQQASRKRRMLLVKQRISCYALRMRWLFLLIVPAFFLTQCAPVEPPVTAPPVPRMPQELCYLDTVAPRVRVDLKYCGTDNFVGRPINGYTTGKRAILRKDAAQAIARAQKMLEQQGLGLLVWDAYRPHRALLDFYNWSRTDDDSTRAEFYPNITKQGIYDNQYIGLASEHSWGIAVDITLVNLKTGKELDMGGRHDLLDASSATIYSGLTPLQQKNRLLLRDTMASVGMRNYSKEWWHYFVSPPGICHRYDFPLNDGMEE